MQIYCHCHKLSEDSFCPKHNDSNYKLIIDGQEKKILKFYLESFLDQHIVDSRGNPDTKFLNTLIKMNVITIIPHKIYVKGKEYFVDYLSKNNYRDFWHKIHLLYYR